MDTKDIVIERVTTYSSEMADSIWSLVRQLISTYKPFTDANFQEMIQNPSSYLFVARDVVNKKIAGMVMVMIYRIPDSKKAYVDDLVVDEHFRNRGIATMLFDKVIATAREEHASYIELTSNPDRVKGTPIYEKLGFQKRETNVYRLRLNNENL
jgi:ribosomal protein S18 acetylase RimI-like enzyme